MLHGYPIVKRSYGIILLTAVYLRGFYHLYLLFSRDFGEEYGYQGLEMDHNKFKYTITLAMKQLFGEMGFIIPIDVLKYREEDRRAFIRFPARKDLTGEKPHLGISIDSLNCELVKVWSSLTMFSRYDGIDCMFRIYKVTPALSCLSLSSQVYEHKPAEECKNADDC